MVIPWDTTQMPDIHFDADILKEETVHLVE